MDNGGAVLDLGVIDWQPVGQSRARFDGNVEALRARKPALAQALAAHQPVFEYVLREHAGRVQLGRRVSGAEPEVVEPSLPPAAADNYVAQIAPGGTYSVPVLIVGLDQGWLETKLYRTPANHPAMPGFRAPIYLLCSSLERLWLVLHVHDWRDLLADPRFMLFVGRDAAAQLQGHLKSNPRLPLPRVAVTVEQGLAGASLEGLIKPVQDDVNDRYHRAQAELKAAYAGVDRAEVLRRFESGRLKVLGITSRFTTFLQHSMRDWLAAMRRLGHETRILLEDHDHEVCNSHSYAQACLDFRPDLVLLIDHYRAEFAGLPTEVPCVMWVQDLLPHLFVPAAGAKQSPLDYTIGYCRLRCVAEAGYPERRFLPATVGVNEQRFAPKKLTADERQRFECDVCYVGHASTPADQIVRRRVEEVGTPEAGRLLWDVYERLRAVYDFGGSIGDPRHVQRLVEDAMKATGVQVVAHDLQSVVDLFSHQVNNSLFRHQTLGWLVGLGVDVQLYGKGWEAHPLLGRYAKGVADNQKHLMSIYQAARINLQVTPHGAVHQRLFEGLACGGFFLVRHRQGEILQRYQKPLWEWCRANNVTCDRELLARATPEVRDMIDGINRVLSVDVFKQPYELMADLRLNADSNFEQGAGSLFANQYDHVAFASQGELAVKIKHYLAHPDERRRLADEMRSVVIDKMSYTATSKRMLKFIKADLKGGTVLASSSGDAV